SSTSVLISSDAVARTPNWSSSETSESGSAHHRWALPVVLPRNRTPPLTGPTAVRGAPRVGAAAPVGGAPVGGTAGLLPAPLARAAAVVGAAAARTLDDRVRDGDRDPRGLLGAGDPAQLAVGGVHAGRVRGDARGGHQPGHL